jgi:AcrR family transcriptional regulator
MLGRVLIDKHYKSKEALVEALADLLAAQVQAAEAVLEAARQNLAAQQTQSEQAMTAIRAGDCEAAVVARNAMCDAIYTLHKQLYAFDAVWNETAPRIAS